MKEYVIAIIGVLGAIVGALIAGLFQTIITRKNIQSAEDQFEKQLQQNQIEFYAKIEQLRKEQHDTMVGKARSHFNAERDRFYKALLADVSFYTYLGNEITYLNNFTSPKHKDLRMKAHAYPRIEVSFFDRMCEIDLPDHIRALLGALRTHIEYYNTSIMENTPSDILEELLSVINQLLSPISNEHFSNLMNALSGLRKYEQKLGSEELDSIRRTDN